MMSKIRTKFRYFIGNILGFGIFYLWGRRKLLKEIAENRILSIYFHNPDSYVFKEVIKWLVKYRFKMVSLKEFQEILEGKRSNAPRTVFISFDDAWQENCQLVPLLLKYKVPVTLFVPILPIIEGQIWLDLVRNNYSIIDPRILGNLDLGNLKKITYDRQQELYVAAKKVKVVKRRIMDKNQLLDFAKYVSTASHTYSHPILSNCSISQVHFELDTSERFLVDWGLSTNNSIAYPNGSYSEETIEAVSKSNYNFAFTTEPEFVDLAMDNLRYSIPRICIPNGFGKYENLARMSSVWNKLFRNFYG